MKSFVPVLTAGLIAAGPAAALAQEAKTAARDLAASCAACHGTDGRSAHPGFKALAGMDRNTFITEFKNLRDGRRPATVMHQLGKGYTDREIELLADYFSARSPGGARY